MTSTARDDLTISAPQLGKSTVAAQWLLAAAWYAGANPAPWWWVAPTYPICRTGFVKRLTHAARQSGILKSATSSPPFRLELVNGATIEGRSCDDPNGLAGETVLGAVLDEFGQYGDEQYRQLSARRAETISRGLGFYRWLGNVGEVGGQAEKYWNMAEAGEPGFACRRWTWIDRAEDHHCSCVLKTERPSLEQAKLHAVDCIRGIYVDFIANEATRLPKAGFAQLYLAEWVDWAEIPAYLFDRSVHVNERHAVFDPLLPLDVSCDFNVAPMAWTIGQHRKDLAWVLDEIRIDGGATTGQALDELIAKYPDPALHVHVYGDATGRSRDTRSHRSDYDIIEKRLGAHYHRFSVYVPRANPPVADRLNTVNGKLEPTLGDATYFLSPRAKHTANDFARTEKKAGTNALDKGAKALKLGLTHFSDADGYRLHYLYGSPHKTPKIVVPRQRASVGQGSSISKMRF